MLPISERGLRNVTAKMRELGMIAGGGSRGKKGGKSTSPASEEEAAGEDESGGRRGGKEKDRRKRKGVSDGSPRTSVRDVARLVMSLSCHGYDEQLAWLEAYLRDEARDRTMDGMFAEKAEGSCVPISP